MTKCQVTVVAATFVALFAYAPQPASAFCIDLDEYCDEFDLDVDGGTFFGAWDASCDQAFRQEQMGRRGTTNSGLNDWVGLYFGVASSIEWDFAARTFSFYVWNGDVPPQLNLTGGFTISAACDGLSPDGGPMLLSTL